MICYTGVVQYLWKCQTELYLQIYLLHQITDFRCHAIVLLLSFLDEGVHLGQRQRFLFDLKMSGHGNPPIVLIFFP